MNKQETRKQQKINKQENKNNHEKVLLLVKTKLNSMEVLISRALIKLYILHDEFVLVNNVLKEYDGVKEEIQNLRT